MSYEPLPSVLFTWPDTNITEYVNVANGFWWGCNTGRLVPLYWLDPMLNNTNLQDS